MKRTKSEERERKRKYRQNRTAEKVTLDREKDKARKGKARYIEGEDEMQEILVGKLKRTKSEEREVQAK